MAKVKRCRTLAIEIRSRKIGYAVFEGTKILFDWGVRFFVKEQESDLDHKLVKLLEKVRPTVILLSSVRARDKRNGHSVRAHIRLIKKRAGLLSIPTKSLSKVYLRTHFARSGRWNKHEVAEAIAKRFPELAWHLPRKRKPWQSEPKRQLVFDAAALALHYFTTQKHCGDQIPD